MEVEELLDILFKNRFFDKNQQDVFLNPSYEKHIHDPFLLKDMDKACTRIKEAISKKEKIVIYSDYDCDGIPAAVIMNDFFKKINYENFYIYIPDRHDEGYGLNIDAVNNFIKEKVNLIITFDLGTTAIEEIALAGENGIDIIVTDHHLPKKDINNKDLLPNAYAIINPKQEACHYPDDRLCGSALAFKLVCAYIKKYEEDLDLPNGWEKWLLDMVGLATLADQVPLLGENRVLAFYGLKVLQKSKRLGLVDIFRKAKVSIQTLNEEDITFTLAPRLNACSRMDSPMRAFELLSTIDPIESRTLADFVEKINTDRKTNVAHIMKDVRKNLDKKLIEENLMPIVVIGNPSWKVGVLGIVASKITEVYKRPAFVWGGDDVIRGSCRSFGDVNLVDIMTKVEKSFINFGGHKQAGGFSVSNEEIHFLDENLNNAYINIKENNKEIYEEVTDYNIDTTLSLDDVDQKRYEVIARLSPFGISNPKPVFLFEKLKIFEIKEFGKEKNHLEIIFLNSKNKPVKAIMFFKTRSDFPKKLEIASTIDLVASFEESFFANRRELRLRIVDIL